MKRKNVLMESLRGTVQKCAAVLLCTALLCSCTAETRSPQQAAPSSSQAFSGLSSDFVDTYSEISAEDALRAIEQNVIIQLSDKDWATLSFPDGKTLTKDAFVQTMKQQLAQVVSSLGCPDWIDRWYKRNPDGKFTIGIVLNDKKSVGSGDYAKDSTRLYYLDRTLLESGTAPMIPGLVRIIMGPMRTSSTLYFGFTFFFQDTLAPSPKIPYFGLNMHSFAQFCLTDASSKESAEAVFDHIGSQDNYTQYSTVFSRQNYQAAAVMSISFTEYLIEHYGIRAVRQVINAGNMEWAYLDSCGQSLGELRDAWKQWVLQLPNPLTEQDIQTAYSNGGISTESQN